MKIIGGQFKGRNFYMPKGIRPTQSIVVKSLFDILGQDMSDLTFLDLFAGSGAIGLEALSRGAKKVTFVEKSQKCCEVIEENINLLFSDSYEAGSRPYELLASDSMASIKHLASKNEVFDIIFVDPPYDRGLAKKALKTLGAYDIVQPNSLVVIQHDKNEILPEKQGSFSVFRQKKYGTTLLTFYQ